MKSNASKWRPLSPVTSEGHVSSHKTVKGLIAALAIGGVASLSAAPVLFPNGDFATTGGADWGESFAGAQVFNYPTTGGNPDGYGEIVSSEGGGYAVLISNSDTPLPLGDLGLVAGETYTFSYDMIASVAGTGKGGIKLESWNPAMNATGSISNSGDQRVNPADTGWNSYTYVYTIDSMATHIKIVPLWTPNETVGFDNIGVDNTPFVPMPVTHTWNGNDASWDVASEWDVGTVPDIRTVKDDVIINAGTVTYPDSYDGDFRLASTMTISGTGSWTQTGGSWIKIGQNAGNVGTINVGSGATFSTGQAGYMLLGPDGGEGHLSVTGGTVNIEGVNFETGPGSTTSLSDGAINQTGVGEFRVKTQTGVSISGGTLTTFRVVFDGADNSALDISGGTIHVTDIGLDGVHNQGTNRYINFTTGSTGNYFLEGGNTANANNLLGDRIRVNDVANASAFSVVEINGGVDISLVGSDKTITATSGSNGSISPAGATAVTYNGSQAYTITPDSGFIVFDVLVDGVSQGAVANYTFNSVVTNHTISATFVEAGSTYDIVASAGPNGTISPSGTTTLNPGQNQSYTITPDSGYFVEDVLVDGSSVGAVTAYDFTSVLANHTISATFTDIETLQLNFDGVITGWTEVVQTGGSAIYPGVGGSGYDFEFTNISSWNNGDVTQPLTRGGFHNNGGQFTELHPFTLDNLSPGQEVELYACAAWGGNGSGSYILYGDNAPGGTQAQTVGNPGANPSLANLTLIGTATADAGGQVTGNMYGPTADLETGGGEGQIGGFIFKIQPAPVWTLTASAGSGGSISPSGPTSVTGGEDETFTITPDSGYFIMDVQVDGSSVGSPGSYTFNNVTTNGTISATFGLIGATQTITASAGSGGSISPDGPVVVNQGASKAFTIIPDTGYDIAEVLVDGSPQGPIDNYVFVNVLADQTIAASFSIQTFTITSTSGDNGSIVPDGGNDVDYNGSQVYTIIPDTGYEVRDVLVDGVSVGPVTEYTFSSVMEVHSIDAVFWPAGTVEYAIDFGAGSPVYNGSFDGSSNFIGYNVAAPNALESPSVDLGDGVTLAFTNVSGWNNGAVDPASIDSLKVDYFFSGGVAVDPVNFTISGVNDTDIIKFEVLTAGDVQVVFDGGAPVTSTNTDAFVDVSNGGATGKVSYSGTFTDQSGAGEGTFAAGRITISPALPDPLQLIIAQSGGNLDFEWNSMSGMQYDLVSAPNLSTPVSTWLPYNDGVTTYENIAASGSGTNMLTGVLKSGPKRFFALNEEVVPAILVEGFEGGAIPSGWTAVVNSGTGTAWEVGDPAGGAASGPTGAANGSNCAGTNISADYTSSVDVSLITATLAIPAGGATIGFNGWLDTDGGADIGSVRILDADNSDTLIAEVLSGLNGFGGWMEHTAPLDAGTYGGMNIKIEIQFESDALTNWSGFYLDDLTVTAN
ncbi:beta strand repeat-containing protein [Haloferula sp.]|uniref:beta strand repeat-containing protein n=1 Tax=Haloferula sp. TaxID=2497595 RepID=UPI00329EE5DC